MANLCVYQDVKRGPSLNVVGEDRGVDEASQISDVAPGSILQRKLSWKTVGTSTRSPIEAVDVSTET